MFWLYFFLLFSLVSGQILSVSLGGGTRIALLDVAVVAFLIGFYVFSHQQVEARRSFGQTFGIFIITCLVSLLWQVRSLGLLELALSSLYLWRFALYSEITTAVANSAKLKKIALLGLWLAGIAIGVLGLLQYVLYPNLRNLSYLGWDPHEFRVFSTFLDPNFTGIFLVLTLILGASFLKQTNIFIKLFVIAAQCATLIALFLTYSRGSYVALVAVLIYWIAISRQWKKAVVGIGLFLTVLFFLPRPAGEGVNLLRTMSVYSRVEDSQEAVQMFLRSPIFGVGFNTLRYQKNETEIVPGTTDVSHSGAGFHNSWLFLLATTGILGFLTYCWLWSSILAAAKSHILNISFIALAVHSMFDNSLFYPSIMVWMWILAGGLLLKKKSEV